MQMPTVKTDASTKRVAETAAAMITVDEGTYEDCLAGPPSLSENECITINILGNQKCMQCLR